MENEVVPPEQADDLRSRLRGLPLTQPPWTQTEREAHHYQRGVPDPERPGWVSFGVDQPHDGVSISWTVGNGRSQVADSIRAEADAVLLAAAPDLLRLVVDVAESDPMVDDDGWTACFHCEATPDKIADGPEYTPHAVDCLWRRCKEKAWTLTDEVGRATKRCPTWR